MNLRALLFPVPALLSLYACATAGTDDGDDDSNKPLPVADASSDANTGRKDSGPASPPRDSGASSSSGGSSSGGSSSGGSSSSSSGSNNNGQAAKCPGELSAMLIAAGSGFPGLSEVASCDECMAAEPGCCAQTCLGPLCSKTYCWDGLGDLPQGP